MSEMEAMIDDLSASAEVSRADAAADVHTIAEALLEEAQYEGGGYAK